MKNQLKSIALLVSVATSLFLTSCGGDKENDPKPVVKCEITTTKKLVVEDNIAGHEKTLVQDCNGVVYVYADQKTSDTLTYNADTTLHTIRITLKLYPSAGHTYLVTESKNHLPIKIKDTEGNTMKVLTYSADYKTLVSVKLVGTSAGFEYENEYDLSHMKSLDVSTPEKATITILYASQYVFNY